MTEKKFSPLGFELRTGSVDPSLPLLFRIGVDDGTASEMQILYVGMSRDGAKAPFANLEIDMALREGNSIVIELVRNVDVGNADIRRTPHTIPATCAADRPSLQPSDQMLYA
ncbi:MAG: hypothetical protein CL858_11350 [Cupriavidus sp.]|nr:hypothetical protein [Cupriavidus sp.]